MTPKELRALFTWDADTGRIFWRDKYKGREAFVSVQSKGYLYGKIEGKNYLAHRVLWALEYGYWPQETIDHINRNKQDNRIANLREVSRIQNNRHKGVYKNNTSGVLGVSKTSAGKWRAYITENNKQIHLGVFVNLKDAKDARAKASKECSYSPTHGTVV